MRSFDYAALKDRTWDNEVLGLVAQIHEYKGRQELYLKQKPAELDKLVEIAKIQSTETSNEIEGIRTTNTRFKQLVADKTMPRNRDEEEIMGYRDVLNTIHESYEYIPIRPNYILQLHRDLFQYSEKGIGGHFKNTQNYINATDANGREFVLFTPLPPYETPAAVEAICESYNRVLDTRDVDALILIPVFIHDFLCIHPFNDGNGRMSRLLTTLLLYRCGYVVGKYISLESKIAKNKICITMRWKPANAGGMKIRKIRPRSLNICCERSWQHTETLRTGWTLSAKSSRRSKSSDAPRIRRLESSQRAT